jgi:hypothetical protein
MLVITLVTATILVGVRQAATRRVHPQITVARAANVHAAVSIAALSLLYVQSRTFGELAVLAMASVGAFEVHRVFYVNRAALAAAPQAVDTAVEGEVLDQPVLALGAADPADAAILDPAFVALQRRMLANTGYENVSFADAYPTPREVYADADLEAAVLDGILDD